MVVTDDCCLVECVACILADVSEECATFLLRDSSTLKIEMKSSSKPSVNLYQTNHCHLQEDGNFLSFEQRKILQDISFLR